MFLKRALYSLRHRWWQNLLLILLFAALFAVAIGSLMLYGTTKAQTTHLQKALGNAVTLQGVSFSYKVGTNGTFLTSHLQEGMLQEFVDDPRVESFNCSMSMGLHFMDQQGLYEKEWEENAMLGTYPVHTAQGMSVVDTSLDQCFTVYGFRLLEGQHLTKAGMASLACLVSRQFAELNGLSIGDEVTVHVGSMSEDFPDVTMQVQGIFEPPAAQGIKGIGQLPEEMLFITPGVAQAIGGRDPADASRLGRASAYVTAYLKSPEDIDGFVEDVKKKLPVRGVVENHFERPYKEKIPEDLAYLDGNEAMLYLEQNPRFDLVLDREWYGMVGTPLERVRDLSGAIAVLLLAAILLVLVLTTALMLAGRRRETGVLLSLGESKGKIACQMAIEAFVPLCLAAVVGLGIGVTAGSQLVENLCNGVYQQSAALTQKGNDIAKHAQTAQNKIPYEIYVGTFATDLALYRAGDRVMVYPQARATLESWSLTAYLLAAAIAALLAVLMQAGSVFRLRPARMMAGKA